MKPITSVTFFVPIAMQVVETMAYHLAAGPKLKVRVVTNRERGSDFTEHPWVVERLDADPRIEVLDLSAPAVDSSLVVFGLVCQGKPDPRLRQWMSRSDGWAIFPSGAHYGSRADWLRELRHSFPEYLRARFLILERDSRLFDFRFFCRKHVHYTPSAHPSFLSDPARREAMFGAVPSTGPRRFRVMFVGNRLPEERSVRLDACLGALRACPAISMTSDYPSAASGGMEGLWIEYELAKGTRGLDPMNYISALNETEFCLSPPGWGKNWTHRTVEAVVRGSIPVIEDPQVYSVPFVADENCILVRNGDWGGAVQRCLEASPEQIATLRAGVLRLREEWMLPEVAGRHFHDAFLAAAQ